MHEELLGGAEQAAPIGESHMETPLIGGGSPSPTLRLASPSTDLAASYFSVRGQAFRHRRVRRQCRQQSY